MHMTHGHGGTIRQSHLDHIVPIHLSMHMTHGHGGTIRQSHLEDSVWYTVMYSDCCAVNPETAGFVKTKK